MYSLGNRKVDNVGQNNVLLFTLEKKIMKKMLVIELKQKIPPLEVVYAASPEEHN